MPWTITDADIAWFSDEQRDMPTPPKWASMKKHPELAGFGEEGWKFFKSSPVTQLLDYLAAPEARRYTMVDQALIQRLKQVATPSSTARGPRITYNNEIHFDGTFMRTPDTQELVFVLKRMCIDAPHAGSISADNWRDFLRFANLLWLADAPVEICLLYTSDAADE